MIERVNLVDSNGSVQVEDIPITEVNTYPGLYVEVAVGIVFGGLDTVLVQRRSKKHPGLYKKHIGLPAGVVPAKEKPAEAIVRETHEETGVEITNLLLLDQGVWQQYCFRYLFAAESDHPPGIIDGVQLDRNEVEWAAFMPLARLERFQKRGRPIVEGTVEDVHFATSIRAQ